MGCSASLAFQLSPMEPAILWEDLGEIKSLMTDPDTASMVTRPVASRDVEYSPGHVTSQWKSPLVVAARTSTYRVVEFFLESYPLIEKEIKREALMHVLHRGANMDLNVVQLLLSHHADIRSPLRMCQAFRNIGMDNTTKITTILTCLLTYSDCALMHGAILNCLCNMSVKIRARIPESVDASDRYLEALFERGVQPAAYWDCFFFDTCICDDDVRPFRPTSAVRTFVRASTSAATLKNIVLSAQLFRKPCDNLIEVFHCLIAAGYFCTFRTRLTAQERKTLVELNPSDDTAAVMECVDRLYKNPLTLLHLTCLHVRTMYNHKHNPLSGTKRLKSQIYLPIVISNILTLK